MADDSVVKLKIDNQAFEVDMDDLELNELCVAEEVCGASMQEIDWESARGLKALAWIAMHRRNPRLTPDDVGRTKIRSFSDADAEEGEQAKTKRPTKAAA